jgi:hypothetical protein
MTVYTGRAGPTSCRLEVAQISHALGRAEELPGDIAAAIEGEG